jgi:hypothetical protein
LIPIHRQISSTWEWSQWNGVGCVIGCVIGCVVDCGVGYGVDCGVGMSTYGTVKIMAVKIMAVGLKIFL